MILKLECLFYLNIYLLFYLILYSKSHFDSNKSKKRSNRKKRTSYLFVSYNMQEEERGREDIKLDCMANTQIQAFHNETIYFIWNFNKKKIFFLCMPIVKIISSKEYAWFQILLNYTWCKGYPVYTQYKPTILYNHIEILLF